MLVTWVWVRWESGKPDIGHAVTVQKSGATLSKDNPAIVKANGDRKVALLYVLDSVLKKCKFMEEGNRCGPISLRLCHFGWTCAGMVADA